MYYRTRLISSITWIYMAELKTSEDNPPPRGLTSQIKNPADKSRADKKKHNLGINNHMKLYVNILLLIINICTCVVFINNLSMISDVLLYHLYSTHTFLMCTLYQWVLTCHRHLCKDWTEQGLNISPLSLSVGVYVVQILMNVVNSSP